MSERSQTSTANQLQKDEQQKFLLSLTAKERAFRALRLGAMLKSMARRSGPERRSDDEVSGRAEGVAGDDQS
jgi:hypothetical protein